MRLVWTRPAGISQYIDYQFRHAPGASVPVGTAWIGTASLEGLTELVQELANGMTHAFELRGVRDSDVGAAATVSATPMADTCMLDLDDRREVWSATMTVGRDINTQLGQTDAGYRRGILGSLPQNGDSFMIGRASYTIHDISTIVRSDGVRRQLFLELVNSRRFTPAVKEALRFHEGRNSQAVSATDFPFSGSSYHFSYHFRSSRHLSYISYCCAESVHTLPYSRIFCCRLWRQRMPSRHDEKGGDGMSISASSVTLSAVVVVVLQVLRHQPNRGAERGCYLSHRLQDWSFSICCSASLA